MSDPRQSMLKSESSLVVIYHGTDPHFHLRDADHQNRPFCEPARPPGVLMPLMRAQDFGLIACPRCWEDGSDA